MGTSKSSKKGTDAIRDPELEAFLDSLVWDDWEPSASNGRRDPPTLPHQILVRAPEQFESDYSLTSYQNAADRDADLDQLVEAWPHLTPAAKADILALARRAGPAAANQKTPNDRSRPTPEYQAGSR